jgi:hypothetical protein
MTRFVLVKRGGRYAIVRQLPGGDAAGYDAVADREQHQRHFQIHRDTQNATALDAAFCDSRQYDTSDAALAAAESAGRTVEEEEVPPPVPVEVAISDETIRDRGGVGDFSGLEHPAIKEACEAYYNAATDVLSDAAAEGRLFWCQPGGNRRLHSQWAGTTWGYSSGAIGTMARDLTDEEKATISAAADAGLAAARKVIEEADAAMADEGRD